MECVSLATKKFKQLHKATAAERFHFEVIRRDDVISFIASLRYSLADALTATATINLNTLNSRADLRAQTKPSHVHCSAGSFVALEEDNGIINTQKPKIKQKTNDKNPLASWIEFVEFRFRSVPPERLTVYALMFLTKRCQTWILTNFVGQCCPNFDGTLCHFAGWNNRIWWIIEETTLQTLMTVFVFGGACAVATVSLNRPLENIIFTIFVCLAHAVFKRGMIYHNFNSTQHKISPQHTQLTRLTQLTPFIFIPPKTRKQNKITDLYQLK